MKSHWRSVATIVSLLPCLGCNNEAGRRALVEKAEGQVRRIAAELDQKTTESGVYVRVKVGELQENDPWGTRLQVSYAQGGVAESLTVRSAGPDREFHTQDDLTAQGMSVNLKGVGEGIKRNAEETAQKAAKGFVRGAVEGVKDSVKDMLPAKKRGADKTPESGESSEAND